MANKEEDYLDKLLQSMNNESQEDAEEQRIKEQVEAAVSMSNTDSFKADFADIYADEDSFEREKVAEEILEDVMHSPNKSQELIDKAKNNGFDEQEDSEGDIEASNTLDFDEPNNEDSNNEEMMSLYDLLGNEANVSDEADNEADTISPEDVKKNADESLESVDEAKMDMAADEEIDKMLEDTDISEAAKATISTDDNSELSESELDRLVNMNLDDIIEDATSDSVSVSELFGLDNDQNDNSSDNNSNNDNSSDNYSKSEVVNDNDSKEASVKKSKEKKKGLLSKLKDIFFDSLDDDDDASDNSEKNKKHKNNKNKKESNDNNDTDSKAKDENEKLIDEVFDGRDNLDTEAAKKGFFAKLRYRLMQMKAKNAKEEEEEEAAEAAYEEERKKLKAKKKEEQQEKKEQKKKEKEEKEKQKKEKPKKEKPKKKEKKPKEPPKPGDILKIKPKSIVLFILFVSGFIVLIQMANRSMYYDTVVSQSRSYYAKGDYTNAYSKLEGLKLNKNDKKFYDQVCVIMYVERQYESYQNYMSLNMKTEALNALIKGVNRKIHYYGEAQELGVEEKVDECYQRIIEELQNTYKISETQAISLSEKSETDFTGYYYMIMEYGEAVQ